MIAAYETVSLGALHLDGGTNGWSHSVIDVDGLGGPALETDWLPRVGRDGEIPNEGFFGSGAYNVTGMTTTNGKTDMERRTQKWRAYDELLGCIGHTSVPLTLHLPDGDRHCMVRLIQPQMDASDPYTLYWSFSLKAETGWRAGNGDGSTGWITRSTGLPVYAGGFPVPISTWPWTSSGTATSGTITFATGTSRGGVVDVRIDGPVSDPRVEWSDAAGSGAASWTGLTLQAGEWLHWRSGDTPMLMDQSPRWPDTGSRLPVPGNGDLAFSFYGNSAGSPKLTVSILPTYGG